MKAIKTQQIETYEFSENEDLVNSATIKSESSGESSVCIFGIDGNLLFESSIEDIKDGEYPEYLDPYFDSLNLL